MLPHEHVLPNVAKQLPHSSCAVLKARQAVPMTITVQGENSRMIYNEKIII